MAQRVCRESFKTLLLTLAIGGAASLSCSRRLPLQPDTIPAAAALSPVTPPGQDLSISVGTLGNFKKVVLDGSKNWNRSRDQSLPWTDGQIVVGGKAFRLDPLVKQVANLFHAASCSMQHRNAIIYGGNKAEPRLIQMVSIFPETAN
jgi:hypothetical protein